MAQARLQKSNIDDNFLTAVKQGKFVLSQQLLSKGANLFHTDEHGMNCLHCSAGRDDPVMLEYFYKKMREKEVKFNINVGENNGYTPLHFAARFNCVKAGKKLIELGAAVNAEGIEGETALYLAAEQGSTEVFDLLLQNGANLWSRHHDGYLPLERAKDGGHDSILKAGIDFAKKNPHRVDEMGNTHLYYFSEINESKAVKALIEAGANCKVTNFLGETCLHAAVSGSYIDVTFVRSLVKMAVDPQAKSNLDDTDTALSRVLFRIDDEQHQVAVGNSNQDLLSTAEYLRELPVATKLAKNTVKNARKRQKEKEKKAAKKNPQSPIASSEIEKAELQPPPDSVGEELDDSVDEPSLTAQMSTASLSSSITTTSAESSPVEPLATGVSVSTTASSESFPSSSSFTLAQLAEHNKAHIEQDDEKKQDTALLLADKIINSFFSNAYHVRLLIKNKQEFIDTLNLKEKNQVFLHKLFSHEKAFKNFLLLNKIGILLEWIPEFNKKGQQSFDEMIKRIRLSNNLEVQEIQNNIASNILYHLITPESQTLPNNATVLLIALLGPDRYQMLYIKIQKEVSSSTGAAPDAQVQYNLDGSRKEVKESEEEFRSDVSLSAN